MVTIDGFDGLLRAAREQPEPQRLLLVFVRVELPGGANPEQVRRHAAGIGGALVPVLYADKGEGEIADFAGLVAEASATGQHLGKGLSGDWEMVIVGCLSGYAAEQPPPVQVEKALNEMVHNIRLGRSISHLAAFDREGKPVMFQ